MTPPTAQSILDSIGPPRPGRTRVLVFADSPLHSLLHGAVGRGGGGHGATWLSQVAQGYAAAADLEIIWIDFAVGSRESDIHHLENQTFVRLAHPKHSWDLLLGFRIIRWRAKKLLRQLKPDVIHCWGTERIHAAVLAVAKCPSILSMQGIITRYNEIGGLPKIWQWDVMVKNEPRFMKAATVVTSESQWGLDQVKRIHPGAVTEKVEYGVHPGFYDVTWQPDPQQPVIFYSGSIDWRKGLDTLLEAAALPGERKWTLAIAGDGGLRQELEARNVPGVLWLGNLKWDELRERLSKAWAFVMPTRADTSPNSVKEARVLGLPVVTTPHGGQAGYVHDGENGFIVEPLTAEGLRAACDRVTASYETAREMGARHHDRDRDYFLPQNTVDAFLSLYRRLGRKSSSSSSS